ncbi:hypothetical protein ANANG_G00120850 [Anguilla anguilla]|uniref:KASH domain-containing protein n=1 Tax=Anguilla anguilla TaxID=7936 RepID=A0A9D3RX61_ANGAN|nr:hypothetical protein ANANG_G00120850 [Anguilla anguilla]
MKLKEMSIQEEVVSAPVKTVSERKETVSTLKKTETIPEGGVPSPEKTVTVDKWTFPVSKEAASSSKKTVPEIQTSVSALVRTVSSEQMIVQPTNETVSVRQNVLTAVTETVITPLDTVLPLEPVGVSPNIMSLPTDTMTVPIASLSVPEQIRSFPQEAVSALQTTLNVPQETVPVPSETVLVCAPHSKAKVVKVASTKETYPTEDPSILFCPTESIQNAPIFHTHTSIQYSAASTEMTQGSTQRVLDLHSESPDAQRSSEDTTRTSGLAPGQLGSSQDALQSCRERPASLKDKWEGSQQHLTAEQHLFNRQAPGQLGSSQDALQSCRERPASLKDKWEGSQQHLTAEQHLLNCQELGQQLAEQRALLGDIAGHCGGTIASQTHAGSHPRPIEGSAAQRESDLLHSQLEEKLMALEELGKGISLQVAPQPQVGLQLPESQASAQTSEIHTTHVPPSPAGDTAAQVVRSEHANKPRRRVAKDKVESSRPSGKEAQRTSVELLQAFGKQLGGLVVLSIARLAHSQQLHSRAHLETLLNGHKMFFQALGAQVAVLGHLQHRVSVEERPPVQSAGAELEQEVRGLQLRAAEEGAQLQTTLEAWTQWDLSSSQMAELLQRIEARLPSRGPPEERERQLVIYQELKGVLEENGPRLYQALDLGRRLQAGGRCEGVAMALQRLEAHWLAVQKRVEQGRVRTEEMVDLWSRFQKESLALSEWMAGARQRLQSCRELTGAPPEELLARLLELAKETEAASPLKATVSRAGAQLLQLEGADAFGLRTQLEQLEQRWADLGASQSDAREQLHKLLMEKLTLEEVMAGLGACMDRVDARLAEVKEEIQQASCTSTLGPMLQRCQECKVEMASHQLSLDFTSQAVIQTSGPEDVCEKRYERLDLAERLGALRLRWLSLKGELATQTHSVERLQQICADRESRLQALRSWVAGRRRRLEDLPKPHGLSQAQRLEEECKDAEQKLKLKSAELKDLRDSCRSGEGGEEQRSYRAFVAETDTVLQDMTALSQQISTVGPTSLQVLRHSRSLPPPGHARRLQVLQEEVREGEEAWEDLMKTWASLRTAVSLEAAQLLTQRLEEEKKRRVAVSQEVTEELRKARALIEPWEAYARLSEACLLQLRRHQDQLGALSSSPPRRDGEEEPVQAQIETVRELHAGMDGLQSSLSAVVKASDELIGQIEPQASIFIESETLMLKEGVTQLAGALELRHKQLQGKLDLLEEFHRRLETLEKYLKDFESKLQSIPRHEQNLEALQGDLFQLTARTSALDFLNQLCYGVTLSSEEACRLQDLDTRWPLAASRTMEMCRELQAEALMRQSFQEKCETWRCFLEDTDQKLPKEDITSFSSDPLPQQLNFQRMFQVRASIGCQILNSVITDALDKGDVEDRFGLMQKLAQLMEQWQGIVQRAQQWGVLVQGLMGQRYVYTCGQRMLKKLLSDTDKLLSSSGPTHRSVHQLHQSLEEFKHAERQFQQHRAIYLQTLDAGTALLSVQPQLQEDLRSLQEAWERAQGIVGTQRSLTEAVLEDWVCCQTRLADSRWRLKKLKGKLNQPVPDLWEDRQTTEQLTKEHKDLLEEWSSSLAELAGKREELACQIAANDMALLQAPEEGLRSQWQELRLKVSLREQEIADRLCAWKVFNENKKWLCDWLMQLESIVAQGTHLASADIAERLNKDCIAVMKFFSVNKADLKLLGEQLSTAGGGAKEPEIKIILKDMEDRWQHATDCIVSREKQLQQRQDRLSQLRQNVSGLQMQLSRAEAQLATPLQYSTCHNEEIQRRLVEQQALERDLEQLSEEWLCAPRGIRSAAAAAAAVMRRARSAWNAAAGTPAPCARSEGTGESDTPLLPSQRHLSVLLRLRSLSNPQLRTASLIEETRQLWREFQDSHARFEDWLKTAEQNVSAKEDAEKFEALRREVQERFPQLELLNAQYQHLARENLTDEAGSLKVKVQEVNRRWDALRLRELEERTGDEGGPPIQQAVARMLAVSLGQEHTGEAGGSSSFTEEGAEAAIHDTVSGMPVTESQEEGLGAAPTHTSIPYTQSYEEMLSECNRSVFRVRRVLLFLDNEEEAAEDQGLTGLTAADTQPGVIQRFEVVQATSPQARELQDPPPPSSDLQDVAAWLSRVIPELEGLQRPEASSSLSVQDMEASVKRLKEMQRTVDRYKGMVIAQNLSGPEQPQGGVGAAGEAGLQDMDQVCVLLDQWKEKLHGALLRCQDFHQTLHSMLLWLRNAESKCHAVDARNPTLGSAALRKHGRTLTALEKELQVRLRQVSSLQETSSQETSSQLLQEGGAEARAVGKDSCETQEKLRVINSKLQVLLRQVARDQQVVQERLEQEGEAGAAAATEGAAAGTGESTAVHRSPERRDPSPPFVLSPGAAGGLPPPPPPPAAAAGLPDPALGRRQRLCVVQ